MALRVSTAACRTPCGESEELLLDEAPQMRRGSENLNLRFNIIDRHDRTDYPGTP